MYALHCEDAEAVLLLVQNQWQLMVVVAMLRWILGR